MDKVPLTIKGFAALEEELKQRQQVERPRIIQAIAEARALGDLSENAEYHAAKEAPSLNEGRILELENRVEALAARNEELVAELDATREALRQALAGRPSSGGRLPAVRPPERPGQVVVWRRGR